MSVCDMLFEAYYKRTPNIDDSNKDDNEPKDNGAMDAITEIIWSFFRRAQLYDQDLPAVKIDFGETGVHHIDDMTVQFPAKFSFGAI
jgi:hypothetical protein